MREKEFKEGLGDLAHAAERDHEVQMARAELYKLAKYAIKLHDMLKGISEAEGLEGWVQSKITKSADMIGSVYHHLDYQESPMGEVTEAKDTHCSDKCCGSDVKAEDCGCPPDCPHCNCNAKLDEAEAYTQDDVNAAIKLANGSTGNMTDATDAIESIADGLADHPDVAKALKNANESVQEMASLRRLSGLK